MAHFSDSYGLQWHVEYTYENVRRCRSRGWPILETTFGEALQDQMILCEVVFALCEDQARRENVDQAKMFDLLKGETGLAAWKALVEASADFFPQARWTALAAVCNAELEEAKIGMRINTESKLPPSQG